LVKTGVIKELPEGYPPPPVGRYGNGKLDMLAWVNGVLWACLIENFPFCPQEFYYWDEWRMAWQDRSLHPNERDGTMRGDKKHPLRRVPYKKLMELYDRCSR
jgi:hypothetical protein